MANVASVGASELQPSPATRTMKSVSFSQALVTETKEVPSYDRTAVPCDIFSCDVCGLRIPSGIRGFEPYGTCAMCEDGFDVCGACCGMFKILQLCSTKFTPGQTRPTLHVAQHKHPLHLVDWGSEVRWANTGVAQGKRSQPRGRSKSPKKKKKLKMD